MSFKWCPTPEYDKYQPGQTFEGSLISIASPAKGLVYFLNSEVFDDFNQIEEHQPKDAYKVPPKFGNTFIWYDKVRRSSYRAYRLNSTSADAMSVKSFLFDIGTIKYETFAPSKYYAIPLNFLSLPPLGLCCVVEEYPGASENCLKMDYFIESRVGQSYNITILRKGVIINNIGAEEKCLVVKIESAIEEESDEIVEEPVALPVVQLPPTDTEHFRKLTYLSGDDSQHIPFMIDQIPTMKDWPKAGTKIMVHLTEIGTRPTCVHARCNTQDSFTGEKLVSEFMTLMMWMNQPDSIKAYRKYENLPIVDEVVLVQGKSGRIFRALVKNCVGIFCQVFLFDFGRNLTVHRDRLFKFPKEFGTMPVQAIRLRVADMVSMSDELRTDAVETIRSSYDSIRMAHVIESLPDELLVNLYDHDGTCAMELLQARIRDQLAIGN